MLYYLSRSEIDQKKWDDCVSNARCSSIYGMSQFLDHVSDHWGALVKEDYEAVMPLPYRKKYGIYYLYQPFFTQQLGIYQKEKLTPQQVSSFIDAIPRKFKYASVNLNPDCFVYEGDQQLFSRDNYVVDLNRPYGKLYQDYSYKTKGTLKQSKAYSLRLETVEDPWKIINLFVEYNVKYSNRFSQRDYERLVALIGAYRKQGKVEQVGVFNGEGKMCSGGIFIHHLNRHVFLFSGNSQLGRNQRGMFFLLDRFIESHSNAPAVLDFAGTTDPGLARFYKGFGGIVEHYPRMEFNRLPWPIRLFKK